MKRRALLALALIALPAAAAAQDAALEARVERLESERAIERALIEYGRAIDEGDFDAYVGLFAPDGEWIGGMGVFEGRAAIRAMLEGAMQPGPREQLRTFHLMSSPTIEIAPDGGHARSVSRWTFFMTGEDGAPRPAMAGRYFDDWVRVDGQWLIARREAPSDIPFDDLSRLTME